jgi:heme oxygenase
MYMVNVNMTLRELTQPKHDIADKLPFLDAVFNKTVSKADYLNYLVQMDKLYETLENKANNLGLFNDLSGIERSARIKEDRKELETELNTTFPYLQETLNYEKYLKELTDPKKVMAHVYVRHMGDLFGGQTLKNKVPGSAKWFQFDNVRDLIMKIRGVATPDLAEEANVAFDSSIAILTKLMPV